jgi:hypothetical protein
MVSRGVRTENRREVLGVGELTQVLAGVAVLAGLDAFVDVRAGQLPACRLSTSAPTGPRLEVAGVVFADPRFDALPWAQGQGDRSR